MFRVLEISVLMSWWYILAAFYATFLVLIPFYQCFGSVFIWSGSSIKAEYWSRSVSNPVKDPEPDPGVLWPKIDQISQVKKIAIYLSLGLHKGRPSYRKSRQPSKENIQYLKTWHFLIFFCFCGSFLSSWIRIRIHWPDWIQIQLGSGSRIRTTAFYTPLVTLLSIFLFFFLSFLMCSPARNLAKWVSTKRIQPYRGGRDQRSS